MEKVKDKSIPYPVKCSFCKKVKTTDKVQGGNYGGRSICDRCFEALLRHEKFRF